ncbi:MAG: hypothetical protein ACPHTD_09255 [Gammaproteobacteria bacterium]
MLDELSQAGLEAARDAEQTIGAAWPDLVRVELIAPAVPHPWPGLLPVADPAGAVAGQLGLLPGGEFVLVRPGGYIACRAALGCWQAVESVLREFLF